MSTKRLIWDSPTPDLTATQTKQYNIGAACYNIMFTHRTNTDIVKKKKKTLSENIENTDILSIPYFYAYVLILRIFQYFSKSPFYSIIPQSLYYFILKNNFIFVELSKTVIFGQILLSCDTYVTCNEM